MVSMQICLGSRQKNINKSDRLQSNRSDTMHEIRKRLMEIVKIFLKKQKGLFIITFLAPIIASGSTIASIWLNSEIFNMGLLVAAKEVGFLTYLPYMGFFLLFSLLQLFLGSLLTQSYLYPKCQLMFRTVYK